jgi:L-asparaginase
MVKNHVHFIKMGGTIEFFDPAYDAINKKLMKLDSTIDSYLKNLIQPHFSYSSESVVEKDSREITNSDRKKLVEAIESSPHKNIIITHGTFTMWQTAQYLEQYLSKEVQTEHKKVILTGSMIPITGFTMSDAGFNLGFTIASFSGIKPGVYMCMNGGIFHSGEAEKNETLLRFE